MSSATDLRRQTRRRRNDENASDDGGTGEGGGKEGDSKGANVSDGGIARPFVEDGGAPAPAPPSDAVWGTEKNKNTDLLDDYFDSVSDEAHRDRILSVNMVSSGSQGSILTEVRNNSYQKIDDLGNIIVQPAHQHHNHNQHHNQHQHHNQNTYQHPQPYPSKIRKSYYDQMSYSEYPSPPILPPQPKQDPTTNAQTLVLSIAFFCVWSPQNLMAPNLTQMSHYFHFTPDQRDIFLGANIAFATGVLSLPVSALLGFYADVVASRKKLFAYTVFFGGVASICTGYSTSYTQLYFARFLCGGCMSGSVPIAFSMLGDFFEPKDRNAASSGLTAMMGAGILFGQVFAGTVGAVYGWQLPFVISGGLSILSSFAVLAAVREPVRGGKEKVLQEMIARGTKYDRTLTLEGFVHAMTKNKTNVFLMIYGFTCNISWGIIFTFLNDYLSQEQGLSVPASTFLVFWFGLGSAAGGILGGYFGTMAMKINRALLPVFMALTTLVGILPFLGLLDLDLDGPSLLAVFLSFSGGCVANLPSVNTRPCLINVNPPETRGAVLTAANLMINVARGAGPSLIIFSQAIFGVSRQYSFNVTIIIFWGISTVLLLILATTLPGDQDTMDAELARYAKFKMSSSSTGDDGDTDDPADKQNRTHDTDDGDTDDEFFSLTESIRLDHVEEQSLMSIEDRMQSFDATAAHDSLRFIGDALREIGQEFNEFRRQTKPGIGGRFGNYGAVGSNIGQEIVWDGGIGSGSGSCSGSRSGILRDEEET